MDDLGPVEGQDIGSRGLLRKHFIEVRLECSHSGTFKIHSHHQRPDEMQALNQWVCGGGAGAAVFLTSARAVLRPACRLQFE